MKKIVSLFFLLVCASNIYAQNDTLFLWKDSVCIHTSDRKQYRLPSERDPANTINCEIKQDSSYSDISIAVVYLREDIRSDKNTKVDFELKLDDTTYSDKIKKYYELSTPFVISKKWTIKVINATDTFYYKFQCKESPTPPVQDTIQAESEEDGQWFTNPLWIIIAVVSLIVIVIIVSPIRKKVGRVFNKLVGRLFKKEVGGPITTEDDNTEKEEESKEKSESSDPGQPDKTEESDGSVGSNKTMESLEQNAEDKKQQYNYDDLYKKYNELEKLYGSLQNENAELKKKQNNDDKNTVYEEIARKICNISEFKNIPQKFIVDHLGKDDIVPLINKLIFVRLNGLFSSEKYTYLSKMWKERTNDGRINDENKFWYDLNDAINTSRRSQSNSQQKLTSNYSLLSVEQKKQIYSLVWSEFTRKCNESKVDWGELNDTRTLDSLIDFFKKLYMKDAANSDIDKIIVDKVISSELPAVAATLIVEKISNEINDKVKTEELHITPTNQDELVAQIAEKLNSPLSSDKIDGIIEQKAEELSKQKIADAQTSANEEIKALKEELEQTKSNNEVLSKKIDQKENEIDTLKKEKKDASDNYKRQKEDTERKHQEVIDSLKAAHTQALQDAEDKRISDLENQKKADLEEKKKAIDAIVLEKESVERTLDSEQNSHKADLSRLKESLSSYVILIKSTFDYSRNAIRTSYSKGKDDSKLSDFVNKNIINNKIYSFEDFESEFNNILANTDIVELASFKSKVRNCFVSCLEMKMPTWLDVLARLYLYSNVDFISAQFASKGINMTRVGEAFMAINTILSQIGVELILPILFSDHYTEEKYELKDIRNIDSYVEDIASHVKSTNEIIDLYTLGYKVDGVLKEKPIVSKF